MTAFKIKSAQGTTPKREARTYARRLLKLADFLTTIKPANYRHDLWFKEGEGALRGYQCGTAACALGWAAASGLFKAQGLRLDKHTDSWGGGVTQGVPCLPGTSVATLSDAEEAAGEVFGPDAFENIFRVEAFEYADEVTPKRAAQRIRSFVKQKYGYALA